MSHIELFFCKLCGKRQSSHSDLPCPACQIRVAGEMPDAVGINEKVYPLPVMLQDILKASDGLKSGLFIGVNKAGAFRIWATPLTPAQLTYINKSLDLYTNHVLMNSEAND